jgi:hypothetical protein
VVSCASGPRKLNVSAYAVSSSSRNSNCKCTMRGALEQQYLSQQYKRSITVNVCKHKGNGMIHMIKKLMICTLSSLSSTLLATRLRRLFSSVLQGGWSRISLTASQSCAAIGASSFVKIFLADFISSNACCPCRVFTFSAACVMRGVAATASPAGSELHEREYTQRQAKITNLIEVYIRTTVCRHHVQMIEKQLPAVASPVPHCSSTFRRGMCCDDIMFTHIVQHGRNALTPTLTSTMAIANCAASICACSIDKCTNIAAQRLVPTSQVAISMRSSSLFAPTQPSCISLSMAAYKDNEFQLLHPPQDGISSVKFAPDTNLLLAASWDETVRLYDGKMNQSLGVFKNKGAVLDTAFLDNTKGKGCLSKLNKRLLQYAYLVPPMMLCCCCRVHGRSRL